MTNSVYATAPFDHAKADIILRSSDNVDFRIFKLFLSLASPFFETLFEIPQPAGVNEDQEVKDGLVVVPIAEESKTVDALLRFCYPCTLTDDPNLVTLKDAVDVLDAARKYALDAIEKKARQAISNPKFFEAEPLRCFAIARRGRWREETLLAAKYTLTQPLIPSWFQEIEMITAAELLALLSYHQRCGEAVYALRANLSWITSHYGSSEACTWLSGRRTYNDHKGRLRHDPCGCSSLKATTSKYMLFDNQSLQWWEDFMEESFAALREKPCKAAVQAAAEKTAQTVQAGNCKSCSSTVIEGMRDFSDLFVRKVEEVVSQIELQLEF
ncbi:hypothetical protein J3R82DRAFT_7416 [Butyriboletus roseoflavus]|nr:hypothetical protein J3R82DRAFT_7416 [Butyriboletus roseoflavus]